MQGCRGSRGHDVTQCRTELLAVLIPTAGGSPSPTFPWLLALPSLHSLLVLPSHPCPKLVPLTSLFSFSCARLSLSHPSSLRDLAWLSQKAFSSLAIWERFANTQKSRLLPFTSHTQNCVRAVSVSGAQFTLSPFAPFSSLQQGQQPSLAYPPCPHCPPCPAGTS